MVEQCRTHVDDAGRLDFVLLGYAYPLVVRNCKQGSTQKIMSKSAFLLNDYFSVFRILLKYKNSENAINERK